MMPGKWKPDAGGRRASDAISGLRALYGQGNSTSARVPANWRDRLPDPATYYAQHVVKLGRPNQGGYAQGVCPFHDDHNASLSVHVTGERAHFRCFACGEKGDMVTFHRKHTGLDFAAAVRDLIGMRA